MILPMTICHREDFSYCSVDVIADTRTPAFLCCRVQHIFDEDAISDGGVVHKDMGHRTDELAVLNDRRAGHLCVKDRTKIFTNLFVNYASGEIPEAL